MLRPVRNLSSASWRWMGSKVLQTSVKMCSVSAQARCSMLNFSSKKQIRMRSQGSIRQTKPTITMIIEDGCTFPRSCLSKMISPMGLKMMVNSISLVAFMGSFDYIVEERVDRRKRLYLSTQQQMMKPVRDRHEPSGMSDEYKKVNHMVYRISAYLFPMSQGYSSISSLASFWVRLVLPLLSQRMSLLHRNWGCTIHSRLTKQALKKKMIVSSSTTPYSPAQFLNLRASTARVMTAVVKNMPSVYLKAQENSSWEVVSGFSKSQILWRMAFMMNLLNSCTEMIVMKTMASACRNYCRVQPFLLCSSLSSIWPLALMRKYTTVVMPPSTRPDRIQPISTLNHLSFLGKLTFSQMISLGSGACLICTSSPIQLKYFCRFRLGISLNLARMSIFCCTVLTMTMAFSAQSVSFWNILSILRQMLVISMLIWSMVVSIWLTISWKCGESGSQRIFFFFLTIISFSRSFSWYSSMCGMSMMSLMRGWQSEHSVCRKSVMHFWMPFILGRFLNMRLQSLMRRVRSSWQAASLRWLSRKYIISSSCATNDSILVMMSIQLTFGYSRAIRMKGWHLLQVTSDTSTRCAPALGSWHFYWIDRQMRIRSSVRMRIIMDVMQNCSRLQKRGKPTPRNESYLEFSHILMGSLLMRLRQQGHNKMESNRASLGQSPGLLALAWSSASFQLGSSC